MLPVATLAEIGVDKMTATRLQALAAIPAPRTDAILDAHMRQGVPITAAGVLRAAARADAEGLTSEDIRNAPLPPPEVKRRIEGHFFEDLDRAGAARDKLVSGKYTGEFEWNTPSYVIDMARKVLGKIDLDPASNVVAQQTVRATRFFTMEDDGLSVPWRGRVWLNPPYAQPLIDQFVEKLVHHVAAGDVSAAILFADARSDTGWFDRAAEAAELICLTRGRIACLRPDGSPGSPTTGSVVVYFGDKPALFAEVFGQIGRVLQNY